ncbi:MAG: DMT family protein [Pseudomonadota bacterium]
MPTLPVPAVTILLLLASNIFMTFAWYGYLKDKSTALVTVIFFSWGIAFFEYCLMVPANRIGYGYFSAAQLKTIQEVITLSVFAVFSVFYLKEPLSWNHLVGFAFIGLGAFFIFHKWA